MFAELQELNLSFLLLAQRAIAEDRAEAIFRLRIDEDMADLLGNMTIREMTWLSEQGQFLLGPTLDNAGQLKAILNNKKDMGLKQTHLAMMLAAGE